MKRIYLMYNRNMSTSIVQRFTQQIIPILERYRVPKAAFFGSLVSGRLTPISDVDILVMPPKGMSFLDFVALKQDIEDVIKEDVDLVSYNGISPYLKESILGSQNVFYETTH